MKDFKIQNCPICKSNVIRLIGETAHKCNNKLCPAKIKGSINHYVSKNCMNIDGFGQGNKFKM